MRHVMTNRDIAELTPAEQRRKGIQRYIDEQSARMELVAARARRRQVRQAKDECENEDPDQPLD